MKRDMGLVLLLTTLFMIPDVILAETDEVVFDHKAPLSQEGLLLASARTSANDGEIIRVKILNTDSKKFTYQIAGIPVPVTGNGPGIRDGADKSDTVNLTIVHSGQFGGYTITATPTPRDTTKTKSESESEAEAEDQDKLPRAVFTIRVETHKWNIGFGGGFTVSTLTSPAYGVETRVNADASEDLIVRREEHRESEVSLGVASLVHVWHSRHPWLAASFGLGLQSDTGASYYFGPSWRMGNKGALTAGVVFGNVDTLPSGTQEGQVLNDSNALNNLGSKIQSGFFVGFSYGFLGNDGEHLQKPFATEDSMSGLVEAVE